LVPAAVAGSKITAVSSPLVSGRGGSGKLPGANAGAPSTEPAIAISVSRNIGS
jgi:hypothetical protein